MRGLQRMGVGARGEGWSHEQEEAERRASTPAGLSLDVEAKKSLQGYLKRDRKAKVHRTGHNVSI